MEVWKGKDNSKNNNKNVWKQVFLCGKQKQKLQVLIWWLPLDPRDKPYLKTMSD